MNATVSAIARTAFVTGVAQGIARAIAQLVAGTGQRGMVRNFCSSASAAILVTSILAAGSCALVVSADVRDR